MENTQNQIQAVFNAWKERQKRPSICRLTKERKRLIKKALEDGYTEKDLVALIKYAYESNDAGPRFWRGQNQQKRIYLDLVNLLRINKIAGRVEDALNWELDLNEAEEDNYGPFRLLRGGQ